MKHWICMFGCKKLVFAVVVVAVAVAGVACDSGDAPVNDHGDTIANASQIGLDSATAGNLGRGDKDFFRIDVPQSGALTVFTEGGTDTMGSLLNARGSTIISADDGGSGNNFRIVGNVEQGVYYISVAPAFRQAIGDYTLNVMFDDMPLADDHSNITESATLIELGTATTGNIEINRDEDYFRVVIPESGTLTAFTEGGTDTIGSLHNSNGSLIAVNNNDGEGNNFKLVRTIPPGVHYISVTHPFTPSTGEYTLNVAFARDDHSDSLADATAIDLGRTANGVFERIHDSDFLRIEVPQNGILVLYIESDADIIGNLLDTNGSRIFSSDGSSQLSGSQIVNLSSANSNFNRFRTVSNVSAGTYYVELRNFLNGGGNGDFTAYTVNATFYATPTADDHGNDFDNASAISIDQPISGSLEINGDEDYFLFDVPQSGFLRVSLEADDGISGRLFNAQGSMLTGIEYADDSDFREVRAVSAGTYFVRVNHLFLEQVDYDLQLSFATAPVADNHGGSRADATPIEIGSVTSGTLHDVGDVDYFRVFVPRDGFLTVFTEGNTDTRGSLHQLDFPAGETVVRVVIGGTDFLNPDMLDNSVISNNDNAGDDDNFRINRFVLGAFYYIEVDSFGGLPGAYTLHVEFTPDDHGDRITTATPLDLNSETTGISLHSLDNDLFRVDVVETGSLFAIVVGDDDQSVFGFSLLLLNSDGRLSLLGEIFRDTIPVSNTISVDNIPPGTYYLNVVHISNSPREYTLLISSDSSLFTFEFDGN